MPDALDSLELVHPLTRAEWRDRLERNHLASDGCWLVTYKKATGKPRIDYEDATEELVCFGWVDSKPRALDDERSMLLCTPRKPSSGWSALNKARAERMIAAGLMAERGFEMVKEAKRSGKWDLLAEVDSLAEPDDLLAAMQPYPHALENFRAFPRSVRRSILEWIVQAKRPETRQKRISETARLAEENLRANQWPQPGHKRPSKKHSGK